MNILITGATGFIGRHLIPSLLKQYKNCHIMTINRDVEKANNLYNDSRCYNVSIDDLVHIEDFKPEIVFHLAAYLTSANDDESISNILQANIIFGVKLLNCLKICPSLKLFVNIGTFAEYRFGPSLVSNAYLYSASKTAFKEFVDYYSNLCGYKYIHIVPYTIYGGEDTQKKIIDYLYDSLFTDTPVKMSGGQQILDFIHINDVVSFFVFIIEKIEKFTNLPNGEILHLGSGKGTKIRELSLLLENKYNKKCNIDWGALPYRDMDIMHAVAPIGKLIELGWESACSLKEKI